MTYNHSEFMKNKWQDEEYRQRQRNAHLGISPSNKGKKYGKNSDITDRMLRLWQNEEFRKRQILAHQDKLAGENNPFYGKHHTKENIEAIRERALGNKYAEGHIVTQEAREKNSQAHLGKDSPMKGRKHTSESLLKMSVSMLDKYKNDLVWREKKLEHVHKLHRNFISKLSTLLLLLVEHWFVNNTIIREFRVGRFTIDVVVKELKLGYEADGNYWHNLPGAKEYDRQRDIQLNKQGWIIRRLSEDLIIRLAREQLNIDYQTYLPDSGDIGREVNLEGLQVV